MRIIVDAKVPHMMRALAPLGEVVEYDPPAPSAALLADAEALITRSVTRIDRALLDTAPALRFVGSATAGLDHVDRVELKARGIELAHAPGANARAVAEYVVLALAHAGVTAPSRVGVVGLGAVGRRVTVLLRALGHEVLVNDPPLGERVKRGEVTGMYAAVARAEHLLGLDELLDSVSVVTLHVPLSGAGRYPTARLLDAAALSRLAAGSLVVNTARGEVLDEEALLAADLRCVLDVFTGEPRPRWPLILALGERAALVTPHIAGYTLEAKRRCTRAIRQALFAFAGVRDASPAVALDDPPPIELDPADSLADALEKTRGLLPLHRALRRLATGEGDRAAGYEGLRRTAGRHELSAHVFRGGAPPVQAAIRTLRDALLPEP